MFLQKVFGKRQRKVVIVQCRLSSTRLPEKALLSLGGKTVLEWVLLSMKKVKADKYYLATDIDSEKSLAPIAKKMKWDFYAGSKTDVLQRFVDVINLSKADIVLRATADNPFLFYEAAQELLDDFTKRYEGNSENEATDYMTYAGLPHGSGVEVFNAHSLVKAANQSSSPYDHEHVGPALYNHKEQFNCSFLKASHRFNFPKLRSTIDTPFDYKRAQQIVEFISGTELVKSPYTSEEILNALNQDFIKYQVLLIPCVQKGKGTGHLRRCLNIALENKNDIYIPLDASLPQTFEIEKEFREKGLNDFQIIRNLNEIENYNLIITDLFETDKNFALELEKKSSVLSIDEGSSDLNSADYLLDIIPTVNEKKVKRIVNCTNYSFMNLPKNVRNPEEKKSQIQNSLVVFGGEDPCDLTLKTAISLAQNNLFTSAIIPSNKNKDELESKIPENLKKYIKLISPVENLKEELYKYDLIVSHYGFTAFEAASANCHVLLVAPTKLHFKLSLSNNFICLNQNQINAKKISQILKTPEKLFNSIKSTEDKNLNQFITEVSKGSKRYCPICNSKENFSDRIIARTHKRTFRRCSQCKMIYMSWSIQEKTTAYNHDYFFADYQKQYGKTYLEDFDSIRSQGLRRITLIDFLYRKHNHKITPNILDIGCAMGPFLDAAANAMWQVFGIDVSQEAVEYVKNTLYYPAICTSFPNKNLCEQFGIDKFDAITMWYVIEHFSNLDDVLKSVSALLKKGGIFAFSTPNANGVSGKYNSQNFYENSPQDHYSIWEEKVAKSILKKYGFKVVKIISTGIHPERFPVSKKHGHLTSIQERTLSAASKILKLGDTFEIYCRKL